jgi:hypothetical protein
MYIAGFFFKFFCYEVIVKQIFYKRALTTTLVNEVQARP